MEFKEEIIFTGGINLDDDIRAVPKGDYRDFHYCRLGNTSEHGFSVVTSLGTFNISNGALGVTDRILGTAIWLKKSAIIYFVYKPDGNHQIWAYYINPPTSHELILTSSSLNFNRDYPIFHANVVDDILKWTDGMWDPEMYDANGVRLYNPPYQINLQKAIDGYYTTIDLQTIDAIKWPMDPPVVDYFTDPTRQDNKLRNKLFKFVIQPIYENGEVGVWSMYSNLDLPEQSELVTGTNWVLPNNDNGIRITFNTGPKIIRKFNLAVQQFDRESFGAEPPFAVFLQLDKEQDNLTDNTIHTVNFYGGVSTSAAIDVLKNYDRLPIVAECQEYLPTNQLTYVNFREGYDKPTELYEILDVQVDYQLNEIQWNPSTENLFKILFSFNQPVGSFRIRTEGWDPTIIFPFQVGMTFSYVDPNDNLIYYILTSADIESVSSFPAPISKNTGIFNILGDAFTLQMGTPPGVTQLSGGVLYYDSEWTDTVALYGGYLKNDRQTQVTPTLKSGATHEFGIVYGDRAYRDSTVYTVDSMNLLVPWFYDIDRSGLSNQNNPFTISPTLTINHVPPIWATKYWIVAKPATEILSFGQYTTNSNPVQAAGGAYSSSISLDDGNVNRYKIQLDKYYETQNIGASIRHQIKVGDKIRFIRERPDGNAYDASYIPYLPYLELDVIDYDPVGGEDGREVVYTNIFNTNLIDNDIDAVGGFLFGQLIEIYTPRPSVDDTGNIFLSTWKDVTGSIEIKNPHTNDRAHGALSYYNLTVGILPGGISLGVYIYGEYTFLDGQEVTYTVYGDDGQIITTGTTNIDIFKYNQRYNYTNMQLVGVTPTPSMAYITIDGNFQVVSNLVSQNPAQLTLSYGDVYLRQRNYQTGLVGGDAVYYYYVEDSDYSDYWLSNVHNTGRTRIEDQNAKMVHRQATAIHSDSFIFGTQINGLSSFALDNQNIQDLNPVYGEVTRVYMSGREGKTLKCLQPKKENSIYIQYYPNEVGSDSTVRVSNTTFASWFDYKSLYGCSTPGAASQLPNGDSMYFDTVNGVFILSGSNGQRVVSEVDPGGKDYKFRTKAKALAKSYNEITGSLIRTYINETMGEVGFAFRFGGPTKLVTLSEFNPGAGNNFWIINGEHLDLYYRTVIVYQNNTAIQGIVTTANYNEEQDVTLIRINGNGPGVDGLSGVLETTDGFDYQHVVFDYVNDRWRSTYDYPFLCFANIGQTLIGFGDANGVFLHNQQSDTFHDTSFTQKIVFVSNDNPLSVKRYQNITQRSSRKFSVTAYSEPDLTYPIGMYTFMYKDTIGVYEGYSKCNYRKNVYNPKYYNTGGSCISSYDPPLDSLKGWTLDGNYSSLDSSFGKTWITIIQDNGAKFTDFVNSATYDSITNTTKIALDSVIPDAIGNEGFWYYSDRAMLNGEDMRSYAMVHELSIDPLPQPTVLFNVAINGVLS
jgi:hypothetical protein